MAGAEGEDWRIDILVDEIGLDPAAARGRLRRALRRLAAAGAGGLRGAAGGAGHSGARRADQPPRPRQYRHPRALAERDHQAADADRLPRPGVPEPRHHPHHLPARRRGPRLQDPVLRGPRRRCWSATPPTRAAGRWRRRRSPGWRRSAPATRSGRRRTTSSTRSARSSRSASSGSRPERPRSMRPASGGWSWPRERSRPRSRCASKA